MYTLPCGDLCILDSTDDSNVTDDDNSLEFTFLGCYTDDIDRVLSGDSTSNPSDMTTEVRRGLVGIFVSSVRESVPLRNVV